MKALIFSSILFSAITCKSNLQSSASNNKGIAIDTVKKTADTIRDTTSISGEWFLMPVLASDTAAGKIPFISFNLKTKKFTGNTGCNAMNGGFKIKQDALQFNENIISTKMACQGYNEQTFFDNLLKTNRYVIKDGVLQLMNTTTVLSKWTRHINTNPSKVI